jgi:hypothetical protein
MLSAARGRGPPRGRAVPCKTPCVTGCVRSYLFCLASGPRTGRRTAGIVQSLAPADALESELAGRVALCLWRLRRVVAYETGVTAVGLDEAAEEAQRVRPDPFEKTGEDKPVAAWLQKARKDLENKREPVAMWEGSLTLQRDLPDLPDHAPVNGDDAYGLLSDVVVEHLKGLGSFEPVVFP